MIHPIFLTENIDMMLACPQSKIYSRKFANTDGEYRN
jgi:hypothetical protein